MRSNFVISISTASCSEQLSVGRRIVGGWWKKMDKQKQMSKTLNFYTSFHSSLRKKNQEHTSLKCIIEKDCSICWLGSFWGLLAVISLVDERLLSPPPKIDEIPQLELIEFPAHHHIIINFALISHTWGDYTHLVKKLCC